MKKSALVSAVAAATVTIGAHATPFASTGGIITGGFDITTPCAATWSGGTDGVFVDIGAAALSGTVCIDPTGAGTPYVMISFSMTDSATWLAMDQGAIQVATNWSATSGWSPYGVINIATNGPIPCTIPSPIMACSANLLGNPSTLYIN